MHVKSFCQISFLTILTLAIGISCRSGKPVVGETMTTDSLSVTVTALNLSESLTRNDEVLMVFCALDQSVFHKRIVLDLKNPSRTSKWNVAPLDVGGCTLVLFLLELDAELPFPKIDSILRVSHQPIRQAFTQRNYSEIERYLGDEDILGIKIFRPDYTQATVFRFSGAYKLDRYEYVVKVSGN